MNEAFNNKFISKTLASLDNVSKQKFRKDILNSFLFKDIKPDTIPEDAMKYIRKEAALKLIGNESNSNMKWKKYWFSAERGYLGFTNTYNYSKNVNLHPMEVKVDPNASDYVPTHLNVLKTGDHVIARLQHSNGMFEQDVKELFINVNQDIVI